MTDDSAHQRRQRDTQIERWTTDARKLVASGKEVAALELYRRAADELPGAPWLQHRTGELSRKLKQDGVAIAYFRRAATAFQMANFPKRALAPLRTAWTLAEGGLPATAKTLVEVAGELMQLHRQLGFKPDASVVFERTNAALRSRGFAEMPAQLLDSVPPRSAQQPSEKASSSRGQAFARLLSRR
ncbi:MAG TPA: hypothetical protein VIW29_06285 [Polyangiaceae bacterium]